MELLLFSLVNESCCGYCQLVIGVSRRYGGSRQGTWLLLGCLEWRRLNWLLVRLLLLYRNSYTRGLSCLEQHLYGCCLR